MQEVEYMVVEAYAMRLHVVAELHRAVSLRITQGWRPQGGVSLHSPAANGDVMACQAMVRPAEGVTKGRRN